ESTLPRDHGRGGAGASLDARLRDRRRRGWLRAFVPEPVGRRADGGGTRGAACFVEATIRHTHRLLRRTDRQHGRRTARTTRATDRTGAPLQTVVRHLARRHV